MPQPEHPWSQPPLQPKTPPVPFTAEWIGEVFSYHAPEGDDPAKYDSLRRSARAMAETIIICCPHSADRTAALRKLREALMSANASIALKGLV